MDQHPLTRRRVVTAGAAAAAGLAGLAGLAGCGSGSSASTSGTGTTAADPTSADGSGSGSGSGGVLAKVADVPVGGAISATGSDGKPIIIAQPDAGKVVAFSAICTHQGCTVAPSGDKLNCPCHGSVFNAFDGAVINGPATQPLPAVPVSVSAGSVIAG